MQYSKILAACALFQGALSTGILTYSGPDCTGTITETTIYDGCTNLPKFMSYKEDGWGPKGKRIAFFSEGGCQDGQYLYDTWAYNGDYFHSKQCYNIDGHAPEGHHYGASVRL